MSLHKELKVPVGLMYGAVGGTPFFVDRAKGPYLTDSEGKTYAGLPGDFGYNAHMPLFAILPPRDGIQ